MSRAQAIHRALEAFAEPSRRENYFDLYSEDIVLHGYGLAPGLESVRNYYAGIWNAFPDARVAAEEIIEAGDRVVLRFLLRATHRGPFHGLPATGKPIEVPGITVLRFDGEKCVERWSVTDGLGLLVQLGAFRPGAA